MTFAQEIKEEAEKTGFVAVFDDRFCCRTGFDQFQEMLRSPSSATD
jgi:hypothetical protein